jgi:hypothetical protein
LFAVTVGLVIAGGAAIDAQPSQLAPAPVLPNAVRALGGAPDVGASTGVLLNKGVVDIAAHPTDDGFWLVSSDGGVFAYGASHFFGSAGAVPLNDIVVGIAPTPTGDGYWLVGADGGVFSYGDAGFFGSLAGTPDDAPILSIAASPSGRGYWLTATDGAVFAFGDAAFFGNAQGVAQSAIVGMAPTATGQGYWLLAADGGVFAFGDAPFLGAAVNQADATAFSIGAAPNGGYWTVRTTGAIDAFGAPALADITDAGIDPAVGIAPRANGNGAWVALGDGEPLPPPPPPAPDIHAHPFLVCTRSHESSHNPPLYDDGYGAINPSGTYRGAYQFSRSTWNNTANHAGRPELVGVDPAAASVADQDFLALHLYQWQGASPWLGRCAGR